jgi:HD superfamily phosphodiesterase
LLANHYNIPERETKLLIQTCLLHDIGRISEYDDTNHGIIAANKIDQLALYLNDEKSRNLMKYLIECHALERNAENIAEVMKKYNVENTNLNLILLDMFKKSFFEEGI